MPNKQPSQQDYTDFCQACDNLSTAKFNLKAYVDSLELQRYQQHQELVALRAECEAHKVASTEARLVSSNMIEHCEMLRKEVARLNDMRLKDIWDKLRDMGVPEPKVSLEDWAAAAGINLTEIQQQLSEDLSAPTQNEPLLGANLWGVGSHNNVLFYCHENEYSQYKRDMMATAFEAALNAYNDAISDNVKFTNVFLDNLISLLGLELSSCMDLRVYRTKLQYGKQDVETLRVSSPIGIKTVAPRESVIGELTLSYEYSNCGGWGQVPKGESGPKELSAATFGRTDALESQRRYSA